jgi:hypothetical protein
MVVYSNDAEVLVCTAGKGEANMLKEYFVNGGRNQEDYDRTVIEGCVEIRSSLKVSADRIIRSFNG